MVINPFDYKDIDYDDYMKALDEKPKTITTVIIKETQYYKSADQLPKVSNDTTCNKFVIIEKPVEKPIEKKIDNEKPHEYTKSKEGIAKYHQIKRGETLKSIADSYNVSVSSIMKLNKIRNKKDIKLGQTIRVL